jgi:hypothetical protein
MAWDPKLFEDISTITSLEELPELEFVWKQYDAQMHGATGRLQPRQKPGTATTLCKAAANCLRLVMGEQQAAAADAMPWAMATQASTVTAVRMILHIFGCFCSEWMGSIMAANNSSRYREARACVETAVQETGGDTCMFMDWHALIHCSRPAVLLSTMPDHYQCLFRLMQLHNTCCCFKMLTQRTLAHCCLCVRLHLAHRSPPALSFQANIVCQNTLLLAPVSPVCSNK